MEPPHDRDALVEAALAAARRSVQVVGEDGSDRGRRAGAAAEVSMDHGASAEGQRILQQAAALVGLERRRAPAALDGFVVAALEAGARQGRTVEHLRILERQAAPGVLARLARETIDPLRAPDELAHRVAARVSDHGAGAARSLVATLPHRSAPPELTARLAAPGGLLGAPRVRRTAPLASLRAAAQGLGLAFAAMALVLAFGGGFRVGGENEPGRAGQPIGPSTADSSATGVVARPRLVLEFDFVGHERLADLPLGARERAFVGALVGETVGGGS